MPAAKARPSCAEGRGASRPGSRWSRSRRRRRRARSPRRMRGVDDASRNLNTTGNCLTYNRRRSNPRQATAPGGVMAVRGEEVASSIESHVREAIEKMVGEIRSSVEDVRDAVDQQLKAALQSVQADVNAISFLPYIQKSITGLHESIEADRPPVVAAPAAPAGGGSADRVKRAIQSIERGRSQVDILNGMLEQAIDFGSRAALLILRGETFNGWKGVGFSAAGGNDEMIKRFNAAP